jgi:hypothetical protein
LLSKGAEGKIKITRRVNLNFEAPPSRDHERSEQSFNTHSYAGFLILPKHQESSLLYVHLPSASSLRSVLFVRPKRNEPKKKGAGNDNFSFFWQNALGFTLSESPD